MGCAASKVEKPSGNLAKRVMEEVKDVNLAKQVIEEVKHGKKNEDMEHKCMEETVKYETVIDLEVKDEPGDN